MKLRRNAKDDVALPERIAALQAAIDRAAERLDGEAVAFGQHVVEKSNGRLRHGTEHTLVAMLGATGAGKSSLTNALAGSDIATTGVRRPTTSSTLACVWGDDDATDLLDWLEVQNRHMNGSDERFDGLVVLDVPDHDSVRVEHRLEMERIAEHADMMVWVTDAEKYADAALHRYLRELKGHGAVMVMVLNKIDGLSEDDRRGVVADLRRLLVDDGIDDGRVLALSASTGEGVDQLQGVLTEAVDLKEAIVQRLEADVATAASELLAQTGEETGHEITGKMRAQLAHDLAGAAGVDAVTDAVSRAHRRDAAAATGWPFTRWIGKLRPHPLRKLHLDEGTGGRTSLPEASGAQKARAEAAIRNVADEATATMSEPWPTIVRNAAMPPADRLADELDQAVGDAVRDHRSRSPRWWSVVGVLQVLLAVAALVGLVWLIAIGVVAWLQLPDLPTPSVRGIPVPTGLLVIGAVVGWLVAVIARRFAAIGAKRAARKAKKHAADSVESVAEEMVIKPIEAELATRNELVTLLTKAGGRLEPTS